MPHESSAIPRSRRRIALDWLSTHRGPILTYLIVTIAFLAAYLSVIATRPLFVPDSQYYLGMSLWFSGLDQESAQAAVQEYARSLGMLNGPETAQMFGWGLVQPRVVLPALAMPFVALLGNTGLALTTGIIAAAMIYLLTALLMKRYGAPAAVVTMLLILSSFYVMWFSSAMLTESLSAVWATLTLMCAWRWQRERSAWLVIAFITITALAGFTRQATLISAGAFVVAWLGDIIINRRNDRWGVPALCVAGTAVLVQVIQTLVFPTFSQADQFMEQTGTDTIGAAILAIPAMAKKILADEFVAFQTNDHALLIFILLAMVSIVLFWRRPESHLLLGAIAGLAVYNITNGTATSFRYAIPGLVFYASSVALLAKVTFDSVNSRHSRSEVLETPTTS